MSSEAIPAEAIEAAHIPNVELHARGLRFCPACQATRLHRHGAGTAIPPVALDSAVTAFIEAHEAAHKAWLEQPDAMGGSLERNLRAALEAAAPYILAAARGEGDEAWNRNRVAIGANLFRSKA